MADPDWKAAWFEPRPGSSVTQRRRRCLVPYEEWYDDDPYDDNDDWSLRVERFAEPGGQSALYAAGPANPRNLPCPTCGWPNRLTPADRAAGYQCDSCANAQERGMDINYYEGEEVS